MGIKQRELSWQELEKIQPNQGRSLLWRLVTVVSFVALFCLVMNTLLNYIHFTKTYQGILNETFYTEAENIAANLEAGLKLGIRLSHLSNGQALLEQAKKRNPSIAFLALESKGQVIHHVGVAGRCELTEKDRLSVVKYPIKNSFGQVAGQLCLGYDSEPIKQKEANVRSQLIEKTSVLFLLVVILTALALALLTYTVRKELKSVYHLLIWADEFTNDTSNSKTSAKIQANRSQKQLDLPLDAFCKTLQTVVDDLKKHP